MKRLLLNSLYLLVFLPILTVAQNTIQPDACVLKALQGGAKQDNATMIRFACVHQYIRAMESRAISVPLAYFLESRVEWFPETQAFPEPIPEHIIVSLKNDSKDQIIFADVASRYLGSE